MTLQNYENSESTANPLIVNYNNNTLEQPLLSSSSAPNDISIPITSPLVLSNEYISLEPIYSLSYKTIIFLFILLIIEIVVCIFNLLLGLLILVVFIPTFIYLVYWQCSLSSFIPLNSFITAYLQGFIPAAVLAVVTELIIQTLLSLICYGQVLNPLNSTIPLIDTSDRMRIGKYFFYVSVAFFSAGFIEENCKYWGIQHWTKKQNNNLPLHLKIRWIINFGIIFTLGFSTFENIEYFLAAFHKDYTDTQTHLSASLSTIIVRMVLTTPFHCFTAYLIAYGFIRRKFYPRSNFSDSYTGVIIVPILIHGTYDSSLFLFPLVPSPYDSVLILVAFVVFVILAFSVILARKKLKSLRNAQIHGYVQQYYPAQVVIAV